MTNLTTKHRLQQQYKKLSQRVQKALETGRFYAYTQYKQQSLLARLQNYTHQLKRLGLAAAVCTGMAVATPAMGQIQWQVKTGIDNPIDSMKGDYNVFVDIDGDGDLDVVSTGYYNSTTYRFDNFYYENVGTSTTPSFLERPSLFNALDLTFPEFVDIDGDGDLDAFGSTYNYYYFYTGNTMSYFENTGTVTNPTFVERTGALNPLDSINNHLSYLRGVAFADIDGDGDQDAFAPENNTEISFYENTGTSTSPVFVKRYGQTPISNVTGVPTVGFRGAPQIKDIDADGDLDIYLFRNFFYTNTGTNISPSFTLSDSPTDSFANAVPYIDQYAQLVDIDGDGDLDLFGYGRTGIFQGDNFLENRAIITAIPSLKDESTLELKVYPNPTTGLLQLEESLTGQLEVFNTLGQVVYNDNLQNQQTIELGKLSNGVYILKIQTEEGWLRKKITIQK